MSDLILVKTRICVKIQSMLKWNQNQFHNTFYILGIPMFSFILIGFGTTLCKLD